MPRSPAVDGLALMAVTLAVVLVVGLMGRVDLWAGFLSSDVGVYQERLDDVLQHQTMNGGEYQPGALFYFWAGEVLDHHFKIGFCDAIEILDCLLLALHLAFLNDIGGRRALLAGAILFLAAGPISIYRFELLVTLLVLMAWWAWYRGHLVLAGFCLGLAVTVKVYPIVLVPILALGGDWRKDSPRAVGGVIAGIGVALAGFVAMGGPLHELMNSVLYHEHKPVALESVLGTIMQALEHVGLLKLDHVDTYGIHGFDLPPEYRFIPTLVLVGSILAVYWIAWKQRPFNAVKAIDYIASILASVVVISTLYVAQYLLWMLDFIVLLQVSGMRHKPYWGLIGLLALVFVAQQYIYPCHYQQYLDMVDAQTLTRDPWLPICLYLGKLALILFYAGLQTQIYYYRNRTATP